MHERRTVSGDVELREAPGGGSMRIVGYAAKFYREADPGTQYELWRGAVERIMPGAFDEAVAGDDVRALFNHDSSQILGRTKSGTLKLSVDDVGLRYEVEPADTSVYRDVQTFLQRGDVDGSSFQFSIPADGERWSRQGSLEIREITKVKLFDVGPVTFPAYSAATSGVRNEELAEARSRRDQWAQDAEQKAQEKAARAARIAEVEAKLLDLSKRVD
jgi:HK97 family phage prohead protease